MIQRLFRAVLAMLVAGVLLTGATSAVAAASHVPFAAVFSGSATSTGPATSAFAGTGIALWLGRITTSGSAQATGIGGSCSGIANVNTETLTAANGDSLTIVSHDVACPIGPGQYHGTGHWNVVGGTGRLARATGGGSLDGYSDFIAGTFAVALIGSIAY
jgi:hypothetical protein